MAITASAEFKARWHKKQGQPEKMRLAYKRRYKNGAGTWTNEAAWSYLYKERGEVVSFGKVPQALDTPHRNVFRVSGVTLKFPNLYNEWLESTAPPSFFAADAVATEGYRCYRTLVQIQYGYELADGTYEWLAVFTGLLTKPRPVGSSGVVSVEAVSKTHLMEKADAEEVRDTDVTLEDCSPPTGDASNTAFKSTSTGVDHATDFQVNAVSLTKGSGWRTSNENEVDSAGNDGKLQITADVAPGAGQPVKVSLRKWLQNQLIATLLGLLFDEAGITSAERSIAPVVIPGGTAGSVSVTSQAGWEAGGLLTSIDTTTTPGSVQKDYTFDDFSDNNYSADPTWTVAAGTWTAAGGDLQNAGSGQISAPLSQSGTAFAYKWRMGFHTAGGDARVYILQSSADATGNGYMVDLSDYVVIYRMAAGVGTVLAQYNRGAATPGDHDFILLRDSSGNITLYFDGTPLLTANDSTYTSGDYIVLSCVLGGTFDTIKHDDGASVVYESEEFDLLATPTSWGTLDYAQTLNGGTVTYKTNVAAAPGGPYDGWVAINATTRAIESNLKRYLKVQITITPAASDMESPTVESWLANFMSTSVFVALANHRGRKVLAQVEQYLKLANHEMAVRGDGTVMTRAKTVSSSPVIELDQENGIIDVTAYDDGIPDRVVRAARVRYGEFVAYYDGAAAGASAAVQAEEAELNGEVVTDDLSSVRLALDVSLAAGRAQSLYADNRRSATDPRPLRQLRLKTWIVPWLELSDVVTVAFYDNPYMRQFLAADPLHRVGPYYNAGAPENILARDEDLKVIAYTPDYDTNTAEMLVEEIPT